MLSFSQGYMFHVKLFSLCFAESAKKHILKTIYYYLLYAIIGDMHWIILTIVSILVLIFVHWFAGIILFIAGYFLLKWLD